MSAAGHLGIVPAGVECQWRNTISQIFAACLWLGPLLQSLIIKYTVLTGSLHACAVRHRQPLICLPTMYTTTTTNSWSFVNKHFSILFTKIFLLIARECLYKHTNILLYIELIHMMMLGRRWKKISKKIFKLSYTLI